MLWLHSWCSQFRINCPTTPSPVFATVDHCCTLSILLYDSSSASMCRTLTGLCLSYIPVKIASAKSAIMFLAVAIGCALAIMGWPTCYWSLLCCKVSRKRLRNPVFDHSSQAEWAGNVTTLGWLPMVGTLPPWPARTPTLSIRSCF